ncbi:hypothetical protein [Runella slithyformis]|uniref:Uncharacterized protein n=1 Tax=Runella slithyformis (strain ATCC 29530 / DSM 19594 / LMG 11500 / NCIMB 11436 / LSU 4) TaxID=761193 RepID=A0A7U3ZH82_RUNSL|nr:hypothetical protein [Runella slithyformis]AEI47172.1 hypothetical protein Runsl_0731 [Runella slithyformis DSM 19594]
MVFQKKFLFFLSTCGIILSCKETKETANNSAAIDSVQVVQTVFQDSVLINKVKADTTPPTLVFSKIINNKWPLKILNKEVNYNVSSVDDLENAITTASDLPLNLLAVTGFTQLNNGDIKVTVRLVGGGWVLQYLLKKNESNQWQIINCIKSYI